MDTPVRNRLDTLKRPSLLVGEWDGGSRFGIRYGLLLEGAH